MITLFCTESEIYDFLRNRSSYTIKGPAVKLS